MVYDSVWPFQRRNDDYTSSLTTRPMARRPSIYGAYRVSHLTHPRTPLRRAPFALDTRHVEWDDADAPFARAARVRQSC